MVRDLNKGRLLKGIVGIVGLGVLAFVFMFMNRGASTQDIGVDPVSWTPYG